MKSAIFDSESNSIMKSTANHSNHCTRQENITTAEIVIDRNIALTRDRKLGSSFDHYIL